MAAEVDVDEAAVDVTVVVTRVPATVAVQGVREVESAGDVAATRHLELPPEVEFAADASVGQTTQLTRFQAVGEVRPRGG